MKCLLIAFHALALTAFAIVPSHRKITTPAPSAGGSSLTGDLVAYWRLDETSGSRADAEPTAPAQTLSAFGSVGSTTGIITNAASWDGVEYLYRAGEDAGPLNGGDRDFTWVTWVKTTTAAANMAVLSKGGAAAYEYLINITNSSGLKFNFLMNQSGGENASATWSSTISDGVWYCIIAWFDSANDLIYISVNDGTPVSASMTLTPITGTTIFFLGVDANSNYMVGAIDETGFWDRLLTEAERTEIYNSGDGKTYPFSP